MAKYKVEIRRSAAKEIKKLPADAVKKIMEKIAALADNPRPPGALKLSGDEKYRLRTGAYRILYNIEDDVLTVYVVKAGHRRDVYR